jgi:hypothetical protein
MTTREPVDATGRPLRAAATTGDWGAWSAWADRTERRAVGQAAMISRMLITLEKTAEAFADERRERERLAAEVERLRSDLGVAQRLDRLEQQARADNSAQGPIIDVPPLRVVT